jgi:type III restriction enzyme
MAKCGIPDVSTLALDRFRLRNEIERRIGEHRQGEHKQVFQALLLPDSPLTVSDSCGVDFKNMTYAPSWEYDGGFQFKKHYFGPRPGELREGTEEFYCAQLLDGLNEIEFWVRNLVRKPGSFRLQTSKDWFYPDFVCKLKDGRALVVEYKGGNADAGWYAMPDSEEKRAIGAVWESRSNGRGLFIMPRGQDWDAIRAKIRH